MANRAIKYRAYPVEEQKVMFAKTFGCVRKVYNLMLADKIVCYQETGSFGKQTPAMYKDEYPYLKEADSLALANAQLNLQASFRNHFDKTRKTQTGFPKFKSAKHSRKSYTTNNQNGTVAIVENKYIRLPKIGLVRTVIHRIPDPSWKIKSATISQESDGTYYISVLFEYEAVPAADKTMTEDNTIGLDYKSDGLYVDNHGKSCGMPHYYREAQEQLAKRQRKLKHKVPGSNNYKKATRSVNRIYRKTTNQRKDFLHKESTAITKQYDFVVAETLNMRRIANRGFGNGKATLDNGYGMFLNMLDYKLFEKGGALIFVDKWFPSSQICSVCGYQNPEVKDLSIRKWACPCCNAVHDRDKNAAINIKYEAMRLHKHAA